MANMSDAVGRATITTPQSVKPEEIVKAITDITNSWEYPICFNNDFKINGIAEDKNTITIPFYAIGRWTFYNSLEELGEGLDAEQPSEAKAVLLNNSWEITFDYLDIEPGQELLYTEKSKIIHNKKESLDKISYEQITHNDYEYSFANYHRLDVYGSDIDYQIGIFLDGLEDETELIEKTNKIISELTENEAKEFIDAVTCVFLIDRSDLLNETSLTK